jgi:O-antigen ligase
LLSNERTASLTFIIGLTVIGVMLFIQIRKLRIWIAALAFIQIALLAGIFVSQKNMQSRVQESTAMLQDFQNSPYMQLWESSYLIWQKYPFFGAGLKNFRIACPELIEDGLVHYCDAHSHNVYLEFLSEMGVFGFLGIILMIASFIVFIFKGIKQQANDAAILTSFSLAIICINFFPLAANQSFFANWPALLAWQSIAWALVITRMSGEQPHE